MKWKEMYRDCRDVGSWYQLFGNLSFSAQRRVWVVKHPTMYELPLTHQELKA